MSFSMTAKMKVFGQQIVITPNTTIPHRIESLDPFTITGDNVQSAFETAFGKPDVPGLSILDGTSLTFSQVVVDTKTQDFQMAVAVKVGDDFFLSKFFGSIISDLEVDLFMSAEKKQTT